MMLCCMPLAILYGGWIGQIGSDSFQLIFTLRKRGNDRKYMKSFFTNILSLPYKEETTLLVRGSLNETSVAGQAYMHAGLTLILSWTMNDLKKNTFHFWEVDIQTLWSARLHFSYESFIAFKDLSKSPADHKNPKLKTFVKPQLIIFLLRKRMIATWSISIYNGDSKRYRSKKYQMTFCRDAERASGK